MSLQIDSPLGAMVMTAVLVIFAYKLATWAIPKITEWWVKKGWG